MKATFYSRVPYMGDAERRVWPSPPTAFSPSIGQASMDAALDAYEAADQLGFDWVTVAEHHYAPICLTPNAQLMAAALSQRVRRAHIAVLGADIPILDPLRVAEEFGMLDNLTGGRIIAGLLRGIPTEYLAYGINADESRARFEEALCLIIAAWTEPLPFGWAGRFYEYRTIALWPRPFRQPHPPVYMSGSSPDAAALAARLRVGVGFAATPLAQAAESANLYRASAEKYGWSPSPEQVLYRIPVHVAKYRRRSARHARRGGIHCWAAQSGRHRCVASLQLQDRTRRRVTIPRRNDRRHAHRNWAATHRLARYCHLPDCTTPAAITAGSTRPSLPGPRTRCSDARARTVWNARSASPAFAWMI